MKEGKNFMIDGADKLLVEQRNRQLYQAVKIIAELEEKIVSSDKLIGLLREAKAELECGHNATALQCIEDALLLFKVEEKLSDNNHNASTWLNELDWIMSNPMGAEERMESIRKIVSKWRNAKATTNKNKKG